MLAILTLHILVLHGMFNSSVLCFEDDGTTTIEYTLDGASCAAHNTVLSDEYKSVAFEKINECEDIALAGLHNSDDQFLINKSNNLIVKIQIIASFSFSTIANDVHQVANETLTSNSTASLTHFKTVSLLI